MTMSSTAFQPMPDLTDEQYAALRADIKANGVIVPVVVDQHGRTLDGHNRQRIAAELGIECPTEVREVADDAAAMDLALTLNMARRHLTQEQKREIIRSELRRCEFKDSDRAIGRRVGCDHKTVGAVRAQMREEAQQSAARARQAMSDGLWTLYKLVFDLLMKGCDLDAAIAAAERIRDETRDDAVREVTSRTELIEGLPALIDHYIYGGLATELNALRDGVRDTGWQQSNMPTPTPDDLDAMERLFTTIRTPRVGNFPTPTTAGGVS